MPKDTEKQSVKAKRDPDGVRKDILRVATADFARNGLSGSRIEEITARTKTSKRMIYYYFGDKEGLYKACLEKAYADVRAGEDALHLDGVEPAEALARLVAFTFDHHRANPDFIRMVMIENIHNAEYLRASSVIRDVNGPAIRKLADIISRGQDHGVFRHDLDATELHWHISALSFFNVSNRATFSALYSDAIFEPGAQNAIRDHVVQMITGFARKDSKATQ